MKGATGDDLAVIWVTCLQRPASQRLPGVAYLLNAGC
jgi:hypothetical protein